MEDDFITYKHYRTINTTAIYVSECGGVMTKSPNMGIRYAKYHTEPSPAMKKHYQHKKYPKVYLLGSQSLGGTRAFFIHRLVAEVWLRSKNLFEIEVDHLDGNIMNFHVLNLEWVTREENYRRRNEKHHYKQYNPKRLKV